MLLASVGGTKFLLESALKHTQIILKTSQYQARSMLCKYFAKGSTVHDMIRLYCFALGKNLLVGTNKGHLLVYEVREYGKLNPFIT